MLCTRDSSNKGFHWSFVYFYTWNPRSSSIWIFLLCMNVPNWYVNKGPIKGVLTNFSAFFRSILSSKRLYVRHSTTGRAWVELGCVVACGVSRRAWDLSNGYITVEDDRLSHQIGSISHQDGSHVRNHDLKTFMSCCSLWIMNTVLYQLCTTF